MADNFDITQYDFLDRDGVLKLATGILNITNSRIAERIALSVDSSSDEVHVPSAAAVYRAIINSRHLSIRIVTGNINEQVPLEERSPTVIYWQRDSIADKKWQIYIWVVDQPPDLDGTWVQIGDSEIDLDQYWSKSDADIASMKLVLGINDLAGQIATKASQDALNELTGVVDDLSTTVATKANQSDLDALIDTVSGLPTYDDLDEKLDKDAIDGIPLTTVQDILDQAYVDTDIIGDKHKLTINYMYPDGRTPIAPAYTADLGKAEKFSIVPPEVEGFYATINPVTGKMDEIDITITVPYDVIDDIDDPKSLLSIAYDVPEGYDKPETHIELVSVGSEYSVPSPAIEGLTADTETVSGTMTDEYVIATVTYTATEVGQGGSEDFVDDT